MDFTLKIRNKSASVSGISALICGNSDYRCVIDYDAEWNNVTRFLYVQIVRGEQTETRFYPVPNYAANLPAFYGADKILLWLAGGDLQSNKAELPCELCAADYSGEQCTPYFDLYNAVMEYLATKNETLKTQIENWQPQPVTHSEYRYAVAQNAVESRISGKITMQDETEISFTEHDILENSFSINANAMNGDFLLPGGVPSAELSCNFIGDLSEYDLSGAEIAANYEVQCHLNRWYSLPLGEFKAMEANKSGTKQLQITAYDAMAKLDHISVSKLEIEADAAYSAQQIIQMIASTAGISYTGNTDDFVNKNCTFTLSDLDDTIATLRDLLMYTAQILNACAYIGREGSLHLARIHNQNAAVSVGERQITKAQISAKRYQLYTLTTIIQYQENNVNTSKSIDAQTLWDDGVYADLQENPLLRVLHSDNNPQAMVDCIVHICDDLDFVVYAPSEITHTSDPSETLLEWRSFSSRSGTVSIPITSYQWTFHGGSSAAACGSEALAGILKTQAEKVASGERTKGAMEIDNMQRAVLLGLIQQGRNIYMQTCTNQKLSHFTYAELRGD